VALSLQVSEILPGQAPGHEVKHDKLAERRHLEPAVCDHRHGSAEHLRRPHPECASCACKSLSRYGRPRSDHGNKILQSLRQKTDIVSDLHNVSLASRLFLLSKSPSLRCGF